MSDLFDPLNWGDYTLKNRFALAPLTRGRAGDSRVPNALMQEYYRQRATAGVVITEATVVSEEGIGWVGSPGIYTQEMCDGWSKIVEAVKAEGGHPVVQLWHCGRASHSDFHNGQLPFSASAIKIEGDGIHTPQGKKDFEVPAPMTKADIQRTVADYKQAALYAKQAGFSAIEVHAANGYLINQFLDAKSNVRDDEYGGSIENRFRFLKEVLEAVLEVWPVDKVGVRLSPNGVFNDMGSHDFREMHSYVAEQLNAMNLGYLHIMDGLAFGFHEQGTAMTLSEYRELYQGTIIANCGYTKVSANQALEKGLCDIVAFGRPYISNPDLPQRFKNDWPLNSFEDPTYWYTDGAQGYTDYDNYQD